MRNKKAGKKKQVRRVKRKGAHRSVRGSPLIELSCFPESELTSLSEELKKLGVETSWFGAKYPNRQILLRAIRIGEGANKEVFSNDKVPYVLVLDAPKGSSAGIPSKLLKNSVWIGSWTNNTYALARRLASVVFRLLESHPSPSGPRTAEIRFQKNGKIRSVTPASAARIGSSTAKLVGKNWLSWIEPTKRKLIRGWLHESIGSHGKGVSDCLIKTPWGRLSYWAFWITHSAGQFVASIQEESERWEADDQLDYVLTHDPLTGLLNRWELRRQMARMIRRYGGVLFVMDLDDFKIFNDTRGHDEGDEMLTRVSRRLRDHFGEDAFLARLGGDEFAVFMPRWSMGRALSKARRLVSQMARRRALRGSAAEPTITVAAVRGKRGDVPSHLFRAADATLQKAKTMGKSRVLVDEGSKLAPPDMKGSWTLEVSSAMQSAEFELWLQPVRELQSGRALFYEALFRLWTPSGLAFPDAVLPAVERLGMRIYLSSMVMHRCLDILRARPDIILSANIGRELLADADLTADLISSFARAKISPSRLILEISEEIGLSEIRAGSLMIRRLKKSGFRFALDDFGKGNIGLMELIEMPISIVKIDPILWREGIARGKARKSIFEVLALFKKLKMNIVAEGVAKKKDLDVIRDYGIPWGQGFFLGKPAFPRKGISENPRGRIARQSLPPSSELSTLLRLPQNAPKIIPEDRTPTGSSKKREDLFMHDR
jgi:diguanylate cyclase (GGDEF)-like protein